MTLLVVLGWVFTVLLLVLLVVSVLAARGIIPVNNVVGVRLPALKRSAAAWRAGHSASVVPAAVAFVVALICSLIGLAFAAAHWGAVVAFIGGVVWVMLAATRAARAQG